MKTISIIYIALFLLSCNKPKKSSKRYKKQFTDTSLGRLQLYDSINDNGIDRNSYVGFKYWNDTTMSRFQSTYIDTFTVGGNQFRIVDTYGDDTTISDYVRLQQNIKGEWHLQKNVYYPFLYGSGGAIYLEDINYDGYKDLCQYIRFNSDVTFYNSIMKKFNDSVDIIVKEFPSKIIDKELNLFCDFSFRKGFRGDITSTLFSIENYKRKDFFNIEFDGPATKEDSFLLDTVINVFYLYKFKNTENYTRDSIGTFKIKPIYDKFKIEELFDYVGFWKKNYKRILQKKSL